MRCLKNQLPNAEIHFVTKKGFLPLLSDNPNIAKVWTIEKSTKEIIQELRKENFDWVIDLHKNLRTLGLKFKLGRPSKSFSKLNWEKWVLVNRKKDKMPDVHIVDRYFESVRHLGVTSDQLNCDLFIHPTNQLNLEELSLSNAPYLTVAVGAQFATKVLPTESLIEIFRNLSMTIVLLGGKDDKAKGDEIAKALPEKKILNYCGMLNLQQSASLVQTSACILSHDTGLMHIASCFSIPIVSVWGNTVPALGMYPYSPTSKNYSIHEVLDLDCRPCSKIGFKECPKGHFNCMKKQDLTRIQKDIHQKFSLTEIK